METKAISTSPRPGDTRITDHIYVKTELLNRIDAHISKMFADDDIDHDVCDSLLGAKLIGKSDEWKTVTKYRIAKLIVEQMADSCGMTAMSILENIAVNLSAKYWGDAQ